jgi:predicted TIM-barrel fold metal-dependent hydrolase
VPATSRLIDFHTHAFPDELAESTVPRLCARAGITPALDGKVSSLLASMDRLGIEAAVVLSVATKPAQFDSILRFSLQIACPRLHPFASVHPDDPQALEGIDRIATAGLKGIKLHPYYQGFRLDEPRIFPLYERIRDRGLLLLLHTGFDLGYPMEDMADPARVAHVAEAFPDLRMVTSHLGGWKDWDRVEEQLIGRPVYMEISYALPYLGAQRARRLLRAHPPECLLFGSDSPWADAGQTLRALLDLELGDGLTRRICYENAAQLLGID